MAETTDDTAPEEVDAPSEYTTESTTPVDTPERAVAIAPARAVGRRKQAIARVRIVPGSGSWTVNGRTLETYFPNRLHQKLVNEPFVVTHQVGHYDVIALVSGGGSSGQAGALQLGVSRALNNADVEFNRPSLKKAGMLTRDARIKERKKAGLKKARKAPQYSKR